MDAQRFEHAIALRDSGRVEEALREFALLTESTTDPEEKASLLDNESTCLIILGRLAEARERLSLALQIAPKTQALLYLNFGDAMLHLHEGNLDKSLEVFDRLYDNYRELLLTPEHRELYQQIQINRGTLLTSLTRFREARAVLEECSSFTLGPEDQRKVLRYLGICYAKLGDNERAEQALFGALMKPAENEEDRDAAVAHYYLGTIYFDERAYAKALVEFEACLPGAHHAKIPKEHILKWLAVTARSAGLTGEAEKYETLSRKQ